MSKRLLQKSLLACARPGMRAMVGAVLLRECEEPAAQADVRQSAKALEERIQGMPTHLGLGMLGLTALFDVSGILRGKRASQLSPEDCASWMESWRRAPLGPARDFVVFYDKMAAFAFHSAQEEA